MGILFAVFISQAQAQSSEQQQDAVQIAREVVSEAQLILGKKDAPLKIVIFDDPDCPFCRKSIPLVKQLYEKNPNKVAVFIRWFPLDFHPDARRKAEIIACSRDYFKAKEQLIKGKDVKPDKKNCDGEAIVERDMELGFKLGVSGTPTFFIISSDGENEYADIKMIVGAPPDYEALRSTLSNISGLELK